MKLLFAHVGPALVLPALLLTQAMTTGAAQAAPAGLACGGANSDSMPLDSEYPPNSGIALTGGDATNPHADDLGDACDADDDNDGILDVDEAVGCNGSGAISPTDFDSDGDLFPDGYECSQGSNPGLATSRPPYPANGAADTDADGLLDAIEVMALTLGGPANFDGGACVDAKEQASVNGDWIVTSADLADIARRFGSYRESITGLVVRARETYDFNRDATIDSADLMAVAQLFGGCSKNTKVSLFDSNAFVPTPVTVNPGDSVTWIWNGASPHSVTSDTALFNSGVRSGGPSFTFPFGPAGSYAYHCVVHGASGGVGMSGVVQVVPALSP